MTFQLSVGREGGFTKLEKWPLTRGNPTGLTESSFDGDSDCSNINTVLFPCMTNNGRKVHITATYHRRKVFLGDLKHY